MLTTLVDNKIRVWGRFRCIMIAVGSKTTHNTRTTQTTIKMTSAIIMIIRGLQ